VPKQSARRKNGEASQKEKSLTWVLLDSNPLQELQNWKKINVVINKGAVLENKVTGIK
jgi:hypothetical protein